LPTSTGKSSIFKEISINSDDNGLKGMIKEENPVALKRDHDMPKFKVANECQLRMIGP
jgi:hypothetical protein